MNNEYLSKLLNRINTDLVKQFEKAKLMELRFIPIAIQNGTLYSVVSQDGDKQAVASYIKQKIQAGGVEFISVSPANFNLLLSDIVKKVYPAQAINQNQERDNAPAKPGDINQVKSPQTKKIGQILVEEKLLTEEQVQQALIESKNFGLPLGSTLVKLGYITIKQLKDALAAQMQINMAQEDQLASLPDAITCLSDDFVLEHKVIPLSYNSKTLTVGMVNPKDTDTINQIIGMTGLKPAILMVTSLEYERYVEQYYKKAKKPEEKNKPLKKKKQNLKF